MKKKAGTAIEGEGLGKFIELIHWLVYAYVGFRLFFFFYLPVSPWFRVLATLFLLAEFFVLFHALGYFGYLKTVFKTKAERSSIKLDHAPLKRYPAVAVVVASYKEPLEVLEDTLVCFHNLTYPNKRLYFLDDTRYDRPWTTPEDVAAYRLAIDNLCQSTGINLFRRKWHHAKAGIINDFLEYLKGVHNPDVTLVRNDKNKAIDEEEYIIVFDADMNPLPNFIEPLVGLMESNPSLAFVQTPQYYTNFKKNRVARASSLMQAVFYEMICEAKGIKNLMIFCGTNVILRIQALKDVGGIDLSSVTEDFVTAYNLHTKKWRSLYVNKVCAFGMGPEDLGAFFKQQHRWALGTVGMFPRLLVSFMKNPFRHPWSFWQEYFLSSSYYLIGWVYFILMLGPVFYLFFDMPIYLFPPVLYAAIVIPYNILANYLFYLTLCSRGYLFKDVFIGVILSIVAMPVYMDASVRALLGLRGSFVVTPKGESSALPLSGLWAQIALGMLCFATLVWGILRLIYEQEPFFGIVVNLLWITYYFSIFSTIFYFNQSAEPAPAPKQVLA